MRSRTQRLPARPVGLTLDVDGALFSRHDRAPWRLHDYLNWRRRVWKKAREKAGVDPLPRHDVRHAFDLQIRGGRSIPELAEQMGPSPQMTVMTYTH